MKKVLITLSLVFAFSLSSNAQEIANNTIGVKLGNTLFNSLTISYQKKISEKSRLEFNLGSDFEAASFSAGYQRVWALNEDLNWYGGLQAGYGTGNNDFNGGAIIGLEYNFESPILLSIETTPIYITERDGVDFGSGFALGVRYRF
ncbi:hypothetical protein [Polaribacter sp.]|uniref:hypothetical protein n=1 Tax=Polaribacter sp. TaxID=1920175 RepID=UPI003F6C70C3